MAILDQKPVKNCEYCGEVIKGRSDKKFCSSDCRNGYHNHMSSISEANLRKVNKILRKNRKILEALTPDDKANVHKDRLIDRGFNFNFFTHIYTTKDKRTYKYCYEYGYLQHHNDWFVLVKRDLSF